MGSSKEPASHTNRVDRPLDPYDLLARRTGHTFAAERARNTLLSETLTILRPTAEDEIEAVILFEKYADQEVSFTDCVSFVLTRSKRIKKAFSFDRHFRTAGFELWP